MAADRLVVPRLTSRSGLLWSLGTLVAVLAVCGYLFATQPENRWAVFVLLPVGVLFVAFLLVRRTWVETSSGVVVQQTLLGRRRASLASAGRLELVNNRGGVLLLRVRRENGRRSTYLPILALTDYVEASQPPGLLVALAEQMEQWAPGQARTATQLRRQAEYLEAGGDAKTSPLAGLVTHGVVSAARGGGAAGGTSLFD
jgi:hypothetical protein